MHQGEKMHKAAEASRQFKISICHCKFKTFQRGNNAMRLTLWFDSFWKAHLHFKYYNWPNYFKKCWSCFKNSITIPRMFLFPVTGSLLELAIRICSNWAPRNSAHTACLILLWEQSPWSVLANLVVKIDSDYSHLFFHNWAVTGLCP